MPIPDQRDRNEAREALTRWLAGQLDGATGLELSEISGPDFTGFSSETLIFDATWVGDGRPTTRGFVVRVQPTTHALFPDAMFEPQWRVMKALADHTDVAVPPMFAFEPDPSVLGAPFIVMGRVDGQAPADNPPYPFDGWLFEASPEEQAAVWWSGLEAMASVHQVDWRALGIDADGAGSHYLCGLDAQLAYYERFMADSAQGRPQPVVEAALAWLRANQPPEPELGLCWGDSRLGNILFHEGQVAAVLDWEMVCLGDPQQDLAWFIYFDRHHSESLGQPRLPGLPSYADTVARWEQLTGFTADRLEYYTIFGGMRFGVIMIRLAQMLAGFDLLPMGSDFERNNTATAFLSTLLAGVGVHVAVDD